MNLTRRILGLLAVALLISGCAQESGTDGSPWVNRPDASADVAQSPPTFDPEGTCSADGWCWFQPVPQGTSLADVWSDAASSAWMVGWGGVILRYEDGEWSTGEQVSRQTLRAIWGFEDGSAIVVGDRSLVLRYEDSEWTNLGAVIESERQLRDVWGADPSNVWAVGGSTILHYRDGEWQIRSTDAHNRVLFSGVYGDSADNVWMVGYHRVEYEGPYTDHIYHWDGQSLERVDGPEGAEKVQDVTIVDGRVFVSIIGRNYGIYERVGNGWEQRLENTDSPRTPDLRKLTEADGGAWVAGEQLTGSFDGDTWTIRKTDDHRPVDGLHARSRDEIWRVGRNGQVILESANSPPRKLSTAGSSYVPSDIAVLPDGRAWASGERIAHFDGESWTTVFAPDDEPRIDEIWANGPADVWASAYEQIYHNDGSGFAEHSNIDPHYILELWGTDSDNMWALVEKTNDWREGKIMHWDGTEWRLVPLGDIEPSRPLELKGSSRDNIWALFKDGLVLHYDGDSWKRHALSDTDRTVRSIALAPNGSVWAAGGTMLAHFDGDQISTYETSLVAERIWSTPSGTIWGIERPFYESEVRMLRWNGTEWEPQETRLSGVDQFGADARGRLWLTTGHGIVGKLTDTAR